MRVRRRGGQLLGLGSDDIDIALDDHTGAQFVDAVNSVLGAQGEAASSVGIIRRNPDQSKVPHIDRERERMITANVYVCGRAWPCGFWGVQVRSGGAGRWRRWGSIWRQRQ
jgi:hypothetical protein